MRQEVYLKVCLRSCVSECVARSGDMSQEVSLTTPVRRVSKEEEEIVALQSTAGAAQKHREMYREM